MDNLKIGIGFDIHRLKKGRRLFLGGVRIPYGLGLSGHSDADVLLHALCDAILGAMAEPDIGCHFPDTDPKNKGLPSTKILQRVYSLMKKNKFKLVNVDCVLIADKPKINTFREEIRSSISAMLYLDKQSIGLKAKTTEGILSFSQKGIAAYCVAMLRKVR